MSKFSHSFLEASCNCSTVVELLRKASLTQPNRDAFTFLLDGEIEKATLTYEELDKRSRRIAAQLQILGLSGERALLLYPAGLDYLAAFFGCLYAGVVAVPAYPPRNERNTPRIKALKADAQAAIALTTTEILPTVRSLMSQKADLESLMWLTTDNLVGIEDTWQEPSIDGDTLAFLQYTSGSTGTPKGVMISHGNLLHNAATTYQFMEHSAESKFVTWLPMYHDMGLIGGILQPLYGGFPCILMPPASFLQRPYRWLQAISRYKGTTSGGPNFAYELCTQKITPEQKATLDLSSWDVAFNGSEPIRHDTLERFALSFAECGFRKEAFYPCYGMAETTLMVSGVQKATSPIVKAVQKSALEFNRVVEATAKDDNVCHFVSCGRIIPEQKVAIANPKTLSSCQPDEVGEIWVSGPSVGQGYWNRYQQTEETFCAYLADTGSGPFLRTGDLGFLQNGELFITGRAKDLIIIRGKNLYPQDIELTAEQSHPSLRSGAGAAFTVLVKNEERLVLVQELEFRAKPNLEEVASAIRQAVTEEHEVQVYGVVLIKPGSIPKTSSGKIQRRATHAQFENGELNVVVSDILKISDIARKETRFPSAMKEVSPRECQPLLESYLIELLAEVLSIAPDGINSQEPLSTLGLDSLKVFELKNRISLDLEVEVSVADFFEGMSTRSLTSKILAQMATEAIPSVSFTQQNKNRSIHPLSFAQQGLWFINQLTPDSPTYNIPIVISLKGRVNETSLQDSLNEIIRRHEVLRTTFQVVDGQPVQVINQAVPLTLVVEDLRLLEISDRLSEAQRLLNELAQQPFDLSSQSLWRAKLLRINEQDYQLLVTLHHIIADGWSISILIKELAALYEAFSYGKLPLLPELPIQYQDFVDWQRQRLDSDRIQLLLTYWKEKLQGELTVLNLPTDRAACGKTLPLKQEKGDRAKLALSQTLTAAVKTLSHNEGVTLFMTLLAGFKTLLYRYTGQTDILVGSPIASRNRADFNSLIGFFVNILVLRTDLVGNPSFRELLSKVKSTALDAYVHQDLPFQKLVEELHPDRDLSYNPLFQVMFVLQNVPLPNPKLSDVLITCQESENGTSKFDLTLYMEDKEEGLVATIEYNTDLFNADTIERMLGHFQTLLEEVVANPDRCIGDLPILTASEQQQILFDWNDTETEYPDNLCVHQLFEQQVERTPDAIALVFENQQLTYRELNNRANKIAHYLQQLGVKPDFMVGIYTERCLEMVVAILAIMKAGGAYLPLDPAYPKERLALMLADSQVLLLLAQSHLVDELPPHSAQIVCIDDGTAFVDCSPENLVSNVKPDNLAYVIYTSGSTGTPKGVQIPHRAVVNFLTTMRQVPGLTQEDILLSVTTLSFDIAALEFYLPLIVGARLVLVNREVVTDGTQLLKQLISHHVTVMQATPATWRLLLAAGWESKNALKILCGGEALDSSLAYQLLERGKEVWNLYGPTETTIWSAVQKVNQEQKQGFSPIGHPIANTQFYILDSSQQLVPVGVPGELHIGGIGLARGYWNRPELTKEKFIPSPFDSKKRLYKTGDLARYLPDGNIEFLGRIDHQVKIRGFRIELGEIEAVIRKYLHVKETVVIAREDIPNEHRLTAYLVPNHEATLSVNDLRHFIKEKLPEYMLPSDFIVLNALPLTPNGKVDRRALPAPENYCSLTATYQPPQSEIEKTIAQLWQQVLHLDKVGIDDNFFDLGGHSLLMLEVNNKLRGILHQDIAVVTMFQNPTIKSLAQYLSHKTEEYSVFETLRNRVERQKEANKMQKQLFMKQSRKTSR